jgi:hypothetical protein
VIVVARVYSFQVYYVGKGSCLMPFLDPLMLHFDVTSCHATEHAAPTKNSHLAYNYLLKPGPISEIR